MAWSRICEMSVVVINLSTDSGPARLFEDSRRRRTTSRANLKSSVGSMRKIGDKISRQSSPWITLAGVSYGFRSGVTEIGLDSLPVPILTRCTSVQSRLNTIFKTPIRITRTLMRWGVRQIERKLSFL